VKLMRSYDELVQRHDTIEFVHTKRVGTKSQKRTVRGVVEIVSRLGYWIRIPHANGADWKRSRGDDVKLIKKANEPYQLGDVIKFYFSEQVISGVVITIGKFGYWVTSSSGASIRCGFEEPI